MSEIRPIRFCRPGLQSRGGDVPVAAGEMLELESPVGAGPLETAALMRLAAERGARVVGLRPRWKLPRSAWSGSVERPSAGMGHDSANREIGEWLAIARQAGAEYVAIDRRALAEAVPDSGDATAAMQDLLERALRWRFVFEAYALTLILHFPDWETRATAAAMSDVLDEVNSPYVGWAVTTIGGWQERVAILSYQAKAIYQQDSIQLGPGPIAGRFLVQGWAPEGGN